MTDSGHHVTIEGSLVAPPKRQPGARPAKPKAARQVKPGGVKQRQQSRPAEKPSARRPDKRPGNRPSARETPAAGSGFRLPGPTPTAPIARVAGVLAALGALALLASRVTTYLVIGGEEIAPPTDPAYLVAGAVWPLLILGLGALLASGRWPRAGLAGVVAAGLLSVGSVVLDLYAVSAAAAHPGFEVFFGERIITSDITPANGALLALAGHGLLGLALVVALVPRAWGDAEDDGSFDGSRPLVGGLALFGGVVALVALLLSPVAVPDRTVIDGATGLPIPSPEAGALAVFDRTGLAFTGGVLLALAALTIACVAPMLRPRQATVAALAVLAAQVGGAGLLALLDAARGAEVELSFGGLLLLAAGIYLTVVTVVAGKLRRAERTVVPAHLEMLAKGG